MRSTFTFALLVAASAQQVIDSIDWDAYLARHDPIWNSSNTSCYAGYTLLNSTIKHESASGCNAVLCASAASCVEESARACDACGACTSFGLSPDWNNGTRAQLFGNKTAYIPNPS